METVKKVWNDKALFKEARYTVVPSLPLDLGCLSLGWSEGSPKIYLTKMVGQEGCIDWGLQSFVSTWKNAIVNRQFTPELTSLFQGVTNELMPGFAFDMASFHWFLRPHAQNTKIGFVLFADYSLTALATDPNSLQNLQCLSQNLGELVPASSFLFRRVTHNVAIGEIHADIFIMISSTSNIFVQFAIKFLFVPDKLSKSVINTISSNASSAKHGTKMNRSTLSQAHDLTESTQNNANAVSNANHDTNADDGPNATANTKHKKVSTGHEDDTDKGKQ
eukprot:124388_1